MREIRQNTKLKTLTMLALSGLMMSCLQGVSTDLRQQVIDDLRLPTIKQADSFLDARPVTVTDSQCPRGAGGKHDYFSEGDYWWPDPENPEGPYIRRDGQSNPSNFSSHREAMMRLSEITATLTSAWLLTGERQYADRALTHLQAWFVDSATMMNPNMLYSQAIFGVATGRGIGLIDAYHLVEVARSAKVLSEKGGLPEVHSAKIKDWFSRFLDWMVTHPYGIEEMNAKNNHSTCWLATAASMASLTGNREIIEKCVDRFKTILLSGQMGIDGSFPLELARTKPYAYSLFNMDAMCTVAQVLSSEKDNLWEYAIDGKSLAKGMDFIFPYIANKPAWPYEHDIFIWNEWPARQPCLLFAGLAYRRAEYIQHYLKLPANPVHPEVLRNLPVRHPVIWLDAHRV
jgi:hypothetical protein